MQQIQSPFTTEEFYEVKDHFKNDFKKSLDSHYRDFLKDNPNLSFYTINTKNIDINNNEKIFEHYYNHLKSFNEKRQINARNHLYNNVLLNYVPDYKENPLLWQAGAEIINMKFFQQRKGQAGFGIENILSYMLIEYHDIPNKIRKNGIDIQILNLKEKGHISAKHTVRERTANDKNHHMQTFYMGEELSINNINYFKQNNNFITIINKESRLKTIDKINKNKLNLKIHDLNEFTNYIIKELKNNNAYIKQLRLDF